ncbi:hypothetical protein QJQ45_013941 [Haematococcus lacustris]|nr:hypothetical protein QJQ45_013941 [Haematococcus lacustris]
MPAAGSQANMPPKSIDAKSNVGIKKLTAQKRSAVKLASAPKGGVNSPVTQLVSDGVSIGPSAASLQAADLSEALDLPEPSPEDIEEDIRALVRAAASPPGVHLSEPHQLQHTLAKCARAAYLASMTHLRLDRLHLASLDLSLASKLSRVTHLYLQHNQLTSMAAMAAFPQLRLCSLSSNHITSVEGVQQLQHLLALDLGDNAIEALEPAQLPLCLRILKLVGNPCVRDPSAARQLRASVQAHLQLLRDLDGDLDSGSASSSDAEEPGSMHSEEEAPQGSSRDHSTSLEGRPPAPLPPPLSMAAPTAAAHTPLDSALPSHLQPALTQPPRPDIGMAQPAPSLLFDGADSRLISSALDMLDGLERSCLLGAADASALRASTHLRSAAAAAAWPLSPRSTRPGSASSQRPSSAGLPRPPSSDSARPNSRGSTPDASASTLAVPVKHEGGGGGRKAQGCGPPAPAASLPATRSSSPSGPRPLSSLSSGRRTPGGGRLLLDPGLGAPAGHALAATTVEPEPAGGQGRERGLTRLPSAGSRAGVPSPAVTGRASLPAALPQRPSTSDPVAPGAATAQHSVPAWPEGVQGGRAGGVPRQPSPQLEQAIAADLALLQAQLETLVEPMAAAAAAAAVRASSRIGGSGGAAAAVTQSQRESRGTEAHADLHRLMGAAAQRVAQQRLVDSQLSSSIQALRTRGDGVADLKHTLSLRTALAAPAGAVQAVRHAVLGGQGWVGRGSVAAVLQQHALAAEVGAVGKQQRGLGEDTQTQALRSSLARLGALTSTLVAEQSLGGEGRPSSRGLVRQQQGPGGRPVTDSKYYQVMLRAAARVREVEAAVDEVGGDGEDESASDSDTGLSEVGEGADGQEREEEGEQEERVGELDVSYALCDNPSLLLVPLQRLVPPKASNDRRAVMEHDPTSGDGHALCGPALFVSTPPCVLACQNGNLAWLQVIKVPEGAVLRGCKKTRRKLREHLRLRAEIHSQLRVIASLFVLRVFLTCLVGYPSPGYASARQPPAVQPPQPPDAPPLPPLPPRAPAQPAPAQPASMECDTDSDSESDCDSDPEPQSDSESESEPEPVTQPPQRRFSARLAAIAPAAPTGPPLPLDCEDPVMLKQLKDFCKFFANPNFKTCYNQLQRRHVKHRNPMLMPAFEDPSNQALLAKLQELGSIKLTGFHNTLDAHSMQLAVAMQQHYSNPGKPRVVDQDGGRVVLVDEHRTSRVSSAVNGKQPCEVELNTLNATRPAGWKLPAGQVEQRLERPAWSQERGQPVRGMMWCPVVAPRRPPQAPRSSQAATQPAASEPGPSTPPPAKRSKPAAEPTKGKGKGKAAKAKPAPQPGRWLDRDCNAALNMQRIGESRWRPLELCYWPDQGALPAKGKEYPGLGYKRLRDKPLKAQEQQQQPAEAQAWDLDGLVSLSSHLPHCRAWDGATGPAYRTCYYITCWCRTDALRCDVRAVEAVQGLMWCLAVAPPNPATAHTQPRSHPQAPTGPMQQPGSHTASSLRAGLSSPLLAKCNKRSKAEQVAEPTQPTKGTGKGKGNGAKAKAAPQPGRWLLRNCTALLNMQCIGESKWRPLELCQPRARSTRSWATSGCVTAHPRPSSNSRHCGVALL